MDPAATVRVPVNEGRIIDPGEREIMSLISNLADEAARRLYQRLPDIREEAGRADQDALDSRVGPAIWYRRVAGIIADVFREHAQIPKPAAALPPEPITTGRCAYCGGQYPSVFNYCPSREGGDACTQVRDTQE